MTNKVRFTIVWALIGLFAMPSLFGQQVVFRFDPATSCLKCLTPTSEVITCNPSGKTITVDQLLKDRLPRAIEPFYDLNIPRSCRDLADGRRIKALENYKQTDWRNIQSIANRWCSHASGWVEFNPGTCTAGGPPPICVVNHWYQTTNEESMVAYAQFVKNIRAEREKYMEVVSTEADREVCQCWVESEEKKRDLFLSNLYSTVVGGALNTRTANNMPCLSGCPIDYNCINGFCVENGVRVKANRVVEVLTGYLPPDTTGNQLSRYLNVLINGLKGWGDEALGQCMMADYKGQLHGFIEQDVAGIRGQYKSLLKKIQVELDILYRLYWERMDFYKKRKVNRPLSELIQDVYKYRTSIRNNLTLTEEYIMQIRGNNIARYCVDRLYHMNQRFVTYGKIVCNLPVD